MPATKKTTAPKPKSPGTKIFESAKRIVYRTKGGAKVRVYKNQKD